MSSKRWVVLAVGALLVSPVRAITVEEFVNQVAVQEKAEPATVLKALPPGLDVKAPLTEAAVVQVMGQFGVKLTTSHPQAPFSDQGVTRLLARSGPSFPSPASVRGDSGERKKKPRSRSTHRPHRGRDDGQPTR